MGTKGLSVRKVTVAVSIGGLKAARREALASKQAGRIMEFLDKAAVQN